MPKITEIVVEDNVAWIRLEPSMFTNGNSITFWSAEEVKDMRRKMIRHCISVLQEELSKI